MIDKQINIAIISMHTSPIGQPGVGDSGGMNVYVREMASSLAALSCNCYIFTRATSDSDPEEVITEPGVRVFNIKAGPKSHVDKENLDEFVDEFFENAKNRIELLNLQGNTIDLIHSNYWLSGLVGHRLKHYFDLPMAVTFHTLDRVKAQFSAEDACGSNQQIRQSAEMEIINCSDLLLASCEMEQDQLANMYGADTGKIEIVPLGIKHAFFAPGEKSHAKFAIGSSKFDPLLLFAGRIQPLKGLKIAAEIFKGVKENFKDAGLLVVGGPSGHHGYEELNATVDFLKLNSLLDSVRFMEPQPHEILSTIYRAADYCLVPSSSESFGLVALEAMACGSLVMANAVGGLISLIVDGYNGVLLDNRNPNVWAQKIIEIEKNKCFYDRLSANAVSLAKNYTWRSSAIKFVNAAIRLEDKVLVSCN